jgi:hypothetical protein
MNALIVVGTPDEHPGGARAGGQLDVEAAAASNEVRVFALVHAASDRVAQIVQGVFQQRERDGQIRPEDRLIIASDVRTNSLIVTSSPRSFSILESLLKTLDGDQTNFSVGLHIIPVTGADVKILAPKIDKLMRERIEASRRGGSVRQPLGRVQHRGRAHEQPADRRGQRGEPAAGQGSAHGADVGFVAPGERRPDRDHLAAEGHAPPRPRSRSRRCMSRRRTSAGARDRCGWCPTSGSIRWS